MKINANIIREKTRKEENKTMKKRIVALVLAVIMCMSMTACGNKQLFDTTYNFNKAIIHLPNGEVVEGKVDSWIDYEDEDQIQVKINGTTYFVHSSEIVLIAD